MSNTTPQARPVIQALSDGQLPVNTKLVTCGETPFLVRVVFPGDRYGRLDCLVHDKEDALVEFYDASIEDTPRGYFVSRYYLETLIGTPEPTGRVQIEGLLLDTGDHRWSLDGRALQEALAFALLCAYRRQSQLLGKALAKLDSIQPLKVKDMLLMPLYSRPGPNPTK